MTMKFINNLKTYLLACLLTALLLACNTQTRQGANREFQDFATWVEESTDRAETATEEEWNELQAEYNRRTAELEKNSNEWDDKTKAEWEGIQTSWQETTGRVETRFRASEAEPIAAPEAEGPATEF